MATHKPTAADSAKVSTAFNLKRTVKYVIENANQILPGKGKDKDGNQKRRDPNTPVLFKPNGRGMNAYHAVLGQAQVFGMDTVSLTDIHAMLVELGYKPTDILDGAEFKVVPVIGGRVASKSGGMSLADFTAKFFRNMPKDEAK